MLKAILLFAGVAGISFLGVFYAQGGNFTALLQPIQPIVDAAKTTIGNIQTTWTSIPNEIKGVVALGIPTAFAMFFAWTKTRAMNKLQQTQIDAQQKIGTVNKQLLEAQNTNLSLSKQVEAFQQAPKTIDLSTNLSEAQTLVSSQAKQIQSLTTENNLIKQMGNVDYVRKLQEALRANGIPLPPYEGTTVTVVK